ncbi:MAG: epimerase, partial [Mycobacterium sp.]|nr:epimerase [Mycobacterium sp.]
LAAHPRRDDVSVVLADLTRDDGWAGAADGCDAVLHVASPFPPAQPENENDVITPAVDGTLRVLRAARSAGVRRVVLTSSFAAIGYSPKPGGLPFDEGDWTEPGGQSPYVKSKTLAERAAWDFAARHPDGPELVVINPVGIFGPAAGGDVATSNGIVLNLLRGRPPVLLRASFAVVDVRDVAALHVTAMTHPQAPGQRFLAAAGQPLTLPDIAGILRDRLGSDAARVPTRVLPDWAARALGSRVAALRELVGLLGPPKALDTGKAAKLLGWQGRNPADTIADTGASLLTAV